MKKKLAPMAAALMLSITSGSVLAATGNMNFSGTVADGTCTVTGLTKNFVIPERAISEIEALANNATISRTQMPIVVTGCPGSLNTAKLTVTYTPDSLGPTGHIQPVTGSTAKGIALLLQVGPGGSTVRSGTPIEQSLISGEADFPLYAHYRRSLDGGSDTGSDSVVAGDLDYVLNLSMAYE